MRRPTEWHGWYLNDIVLGSSPSSSDILGVSTLASYTKPTITRIIGDLTYRLNVSGTIEFQAASIFVGIGVFDEDAAPDPMVELDRAGWMWVGSDLVGAPEAAYPKGDGTTQDVVLSGYRKARFHVDCRAQRIVGPDHRLIIVTRFQDEQGTPDNPALTGHLRVLVKE